MAVEARRGCGYRTVGSLYLVTDGLGELCERLPVILEICPHCGAGIKQSRAWSWLSYDLLDELADPCDKSGDSPMGPGYHCQRCPLCSRWIFKKSAEPADRVGLIWIGEKHYPTPFDWSAEAVNLGISRRITSIPKDYVAGKTWIAFAHPRGVTRPNSHEPGESNETEFAEQEDLFETVPAIIHIARPTRIELIVTKEMKSEPWVQELVVNERVKLVEVPASDPDHWPARTPARSKRVAAADSFREDAEDAAARPIRHRIKKLIRRGSYAK